VSVALYLLTPHDEPTCSPTSWRPSLSLSVGPRGIPFSPWFSPRPPPPPRTRLPPCPSASMPALFTALADKKMMHRTAVGALSVFTYPSTWAPAWAREEALPDLTKTLSHATFWGMDPARPANPLAEQITAMPHARVPSLGDRDSSTTVVRRRREVGYRFSYLGFMDDPSADPPLLATFDYILTPPPYIEEADMKSPATV